MYNGPLFVLKLSGMHILANILYRQLHIDSNCSVISFALPLMVAMKMKTFGLGAISIKLNKLVVFNFSTANCSSEVQKQGQAVGI